MTENEKKRKIRKKENEGKTRKGGQSIKGRGIKNKRAEKDIKKGRKYRIQSIQAMQMY